MSDNPTSLFCLSRSSLGALGRQGSSHGQQPWAGLLLCPWKEGREHRGALLGRKPEGPGGAARVIEFDFVRSLCLGLSRGTTRTWHTFPVRVCGHAPSSLGMGLGDGGPATCLPGEGVRPPSARHRAQADELGGSRPSVLSHHSGISVKCI